MADPKYVALVLAGLVCPGAGAAAQAPSPQAPRFDVQRLGDGVYAAIRREPPSLYFESNSVFIIGDEDVTVVDAQFSLETTTEVLAALRRLTDKPVRYVVNTHGHDDHVTGNQVYRDTFPGVEFIAHRATRDTMVAAGAEKRAAFLASLPGTVGYFRSLLTGGKGPDGAPITPEESAGFASDSLIGTRFLAEAPDLELVPATRVVDDRLVLRQGRRVIEILWLGMGHSAGDLVVNLPEERIVAAGDLVVAPVPLVGSTSHPAAFASTLARLRALHPAILVPGHGPVQRDDHHVASVQRMLESIGTQVAAAVARGDSLPDVRNAVDLHEFRDIFAGDSELQRFVFQNYVTLPAVAAAYADAMDAGRSASREQEALAVVQRLFDAMATRDTARMRTLFDPEAKLVGMRPGANGGAPRVQRLTAAQFIDFVGRDTRGPWIERAFDPEVRVSGTLATVWAAYDFHFGDEFSHCGVDAVQLLDTAEGWKIMSIADTFVREGCPSHP